MRTWDLVLPVERANGSALFLQIARGIAEHIRTGRLRPGDPIPGTRSLARTLGVHRNTVIAACRELTAEGWLTSHPARGTFVSRALPDPAPRPFTSVVRPLAPAAAPMRPPYPLRPAPPPWLTMNAPPGATMLIGGKPDLSLVPTTALARAYRRTLKRSGADVLGYGDPRGHERLRAAIASMLASTRGLPVTSEEVLITRGSQMAVFVIARTLFGPGDVIAIESLGYVPAWETLRSTGARLVPVPVDESGLQVDALERLMKRERVRAVYLTPHHQYPTTVTLSPGRRIELLELARRRRLAIIEDDYDHEFHFDGRPILPLASSDRTGRVVYLGTLSKVLAPGLRIGYVVAPAPVIKRMGEHRTFVDISGDHAMECAVAELFEDGEMQRHTRRARRIYMARRDALVTALRTHLAGVLSFEVPTGGMALWARAAKSVRVDAWAERCAAVGVRFQPGRQFAFDRRSVPCVRLGFAPVGELEIEGAVRKMASAL
ncbi:MAG TPA: PLP-dependent aminotransferase family protein [Candidatus Limnocylindria bacterium]|nr:PLP-dependent aminotransferase family protein [Candidatus Limnocylindria bacterium]